MVGKTTLARLMATAFDAEFIALSAVLSGVKDIREAVERAEQYRAHGRRTLVFVDEVHRFNKSQQDAFPAACGKRAVHLYRRHHRESVLLSQRRLAVARRGVCAQEPG
ncbi:AAA family ATPase [Cupriavidus basilensis]